MGVVVWSTIAGRTVHEGDEGLPIYRQRILLGRMYWSRSYAQRWQVWLIWAAFPLILLGIVLFNP